MFKWSPLQDKGKEDQELTVPTHEEVFEMKNYIRDSFSVNPKPNKQVNNRLKWYSHV